MYYEDRIFTKKDINLLVFENSEFLSCTFEKMTFHKTNFNGTTFENCTFKLCELNSSTFYHSKFIDLNFESSELINIILSNINPFIIEVNFINSYLKYCDFSKLELTKIDFSNSILKECLFFNTNLNKASFKKSNLEGSCFDNCNLENTNFIDATNYNINPTKNRITGGKFSIPDLIGLLKCFNIKINI